MFNPKRYKMAEYANCSRVSACSGCDGYKEVLYHWADGSYTESHYICQPFNIGLPSPQRNQYAANRPCMSILAAFLNADKNIDELKKQMIAEYDVKIFG